jgi:hypothetical protein
MRVLKTASEEMADQFLKAEEYVRRTEAAASEFDI